MNLRRASKEKLIAVAVEYLSPRFRPYFHDEGSEVELIGSFTPAAGDGYIGLRVTVPNRPQLFVRLSQIRRGIAYTILASATRVPFDMAALDRSDSDG